MFFRSNFFLFFYFLNVTCNPDVAYWHSDEAKVTEKNDEKKMKWRERKGKAIHLHMYSKFRIH